MADAVRATIADPELWAARTEDELLERYHPAKVGRPMSTGLRPVFGEFNNWYVTQVCQWLPRNRSGESEVR